MIKGLFTFLLTLSVVGPASAEKMDVDTHSLVIKKLEAALDNMGRNNVSRIAVTKRLADLYAERARLLSMREIEKNCNNCLGSKQDRRKALKNYEIVLTKGKDSNPGHIITQMAHLYDYLGQTAKAIGLHNKIIHTGRPKYSPRLISSSHLALGIINYHKGLFSVAKRHLEKSQKNASQRKLGFIKYHLAWCYLNLNQPDRARRMMTAILKDPNLLVRSGKGDKLDRSFQQQASKDLATFYARSRVGQKEVQQLFNLSPEDTRLDNLKYLATEVQRLGGKKSALSIWQVYINNEHNKEQHVEAYIRMAQLNLDVGWKKSTVREITKAAQLWKKGYCKDEVECEVLRKRFRNLVIGWNNLEKNTPSSQLVNAYDIYLSVFSEDSEMYGWAAKVAQQNGNNKFASKHFRVAADLAADELDNTNTKSVRNKLEAALLGEIEAAEALKSTKSRELAYKHYLDLNPNGKKKDEVVYQRAHLAYQQKEYQKAAKAFHAIAVDNTIKDKGLRKKAANLCLDALAIEKNHQLIEVWAADFAKIFRNQEYLAISRKSVHNQVALVARSSHSDKSDLRKALKKLKKTKLKGATYDERINHYKDQLSLAKKTEDIASAVVATNGILYTKNLTESDREYGMAQRVWLAEIALDFKTAYKLSRNMKMRKLSAEKRHMRLAVLAELAGRSSHKHYQDFIKATPSIRRANEIRARLVMRAKYPWLKLEEYKSRLSRTPDILANLSLEVFAKHRNFTRAKKILKNRRVAKQPAGLLLARQVFYSDFNDLNHRLKRHRIRTSSNYLLGKSIKKRIKLIGESEKLAKKAAKKKDWVLQLLSLSTVKEQYERLGAKISSLPAPKNLKAAQRSQYKKLLAQQAAPYNKEAARIERKLSQLWKYKISFKRVLNNHYVAKPAVRNITRAELLHLVSVAPGYRKSKLQSALDHKSSRPKHREVMAARNELRENPFNLKKARRLRELESQAGGDVMVAFLDARTVSLKKGARR